MNNTINLRTGLIALMILLAALSRLLPHPPNFTPVGAMGLFGAAYFTRKYLAFIIPIAALFISDFLLNNLVYARLYPEFYGEGIVWFSNLGIYFAFAVIIAAGFLFLRKVKLSNLLIASLVASVLFFLITNFGSMLLDPRYPKTFSGLMAAYTAGIPFFWNTLLGDLFFTGVLFGSFEWVKRSHPSLAFSK
jgi:hypothetical protein